MKKRGLLLLSLVGFNAVAFIVSASFAWFRSFNEIGSETTSGITGSLFTGYFHGGAGTVGDPFTITRPKHWENLVWLHNNVEGFYNANGKESALETGHGYYFQIGVVGLDKTSTVAQVYQYDDNGYPILDGNGDPLYSTSTLNLKCYSKEGDELIPIGSPKYPFIGALNGNNFELTGFKVLSYDKYRHNEDLEDVGVFGYVGPSYGATTEDPAITNIYFNNFTIDTSSASLDDETTVYIHHPTHTPEVPAGQEPPDYHGKAYIGYIAGHINTSDSFENVYVNNCKIDGECDDTAGQLSNYGYFGKVEYAKSGSSTGSGNDYSFSLDSSAVYDFMRANYDTIKNNPIAIRNAEYQLNPKGSTMFNGNKTIHPYSEGFAYVTSGFNTYNMIGDDPDDYGAGQYKGYNYSLSTMGWWPMQETGETTTYGLKVKNSSTSAYYDIDNNAKIQSSLTEGDAGYVYPYATAKSWFGQNGKYMHYDSSAGKWDYYNVHTHAKDDMKSVNLTFTCNRSFTSGSSHTMTRNPDLNSAYFQVYVDGKPYYSSFQNVASYVSTSRVDSNKHLRTVISNFSMTIPNFSIAVGVHKIAAVIAVKVTTSYFRYSGYYYGSSASVDGNDIIPVGTDFTVTNNDGGTTKTFDLAKSIYSSGYQTETDDVNIVCKDSNTYTPYVYSDTRDDYVYCTKLTASGQEFDPNNCYIFNVYEGVTFEHITGKYDDGTTYNYWHAVVESQKSIPSGAKENWVATKDENQTAPNINDYYDEGAALYDPENIDVVGGGIRFGASHVTFDGENGSRTLAKTLTSKDIGQKFYPTKYCPNSVVLYLKNVGGTNLDDKMGTIEISYSWLAISGQLCEMLFKKGAGLGTDGGYYLALSNAATGDDFDDDISWNSRYSTIILRRKYLANASYCALDKSGNIIANYNASGQQVLPSGGGAVSPRDIDKYVLVIGSKTTTVLGIDANVRLDYINFDYTAEHGFGGTFGSVEYRSRTETVQDTIVNLYYLIPVDDRYRVHVTYTSASSRYDITFNYYSATRASLKIFVYCYNLTFHVYLNNTEVATNGTEEVTISSAPFV